MNVLIPDYKMGSQWKQLSMSKTQHLVVDLPVRNFIYLAIILTFLNLKI